jgi:hypothetical protein
MLGMQVGVVRRKGVGCRGDARVREVGSVWCVTVSKSYSNASFESGCTKEAWRRALPYCLLNLHILGTVDWGMCSGRGLVVVVGESRTCTHCKFGRNMHCSNSQAKVVEIPAFQSPLLSSI